MFGLMGFGRDVDDRIFFRSHVGTVVGVDSAAGHPAGTHRLAFGLNRRPMTQVGVEQVLQIGPQRGQLGAQRGHLVGGLGAYLGRELTAQLRFDRQLVLAPRRDFAVQLQVVDQLQVTRPGLIDVALPAIDDRHERRHHGRPQREDDGELEQLDPVGEHQRGTRHDCEDQQHR